MVPSDTVTCKHCADSHAFMVTVRRNLLQILRRERATATTPKRRNALLRGITQLKARLAEPAPAGCTWIQHHPKRFMV